MPLKKQTLSIRDVELLREAVQQAESWRGAKMPEDWPEFDAHIRRMYRALAAAERTRECYERLLKSTNAVTN